MAAYVAFIADGAVHQPLFYVYPFVWLNVAIWAVRRVPHSPPSQRVRWDGVAVALGYFAVLAYAGGLVGFNSGAETGVRLVLTSAPPGWAPALLYDGATVSVALLPFKVAGYAALAFLVYVAVRDIGGGCPTGGRTHTNDAASGIVGGLLGTISCVSCTLPAAASVVGGVTGSGAVVLAAYGQSYMLSTVAFVVTVLLLTWRSAG